MKNTFFAIEENTISSYNYKIGSTFTSGPRYNSPIIHAAEQPASYSALVALESGEVNALDMPKQVLILKSLHTWLELRVASNPFRLACHADGNTMACLDVTGKLTFYNLNNTNSVQAIHKLDMGNGPVELKNMFHPGTSRKLVVHQITSGKPSAYIINPDTDFLLIELDAISPELVGQLGGNIWLLDTEKRWKHYTVS